MAEKKNIVRQEELEKFSLNGSAIYVLIKAKLSLCDAVQCSRALKRYTLV